MIKPPAKIFSKTNHKLSFLLGVVLTIIGITFVSALVMWVLKINPQDILLQLEEIKTTPISEDEQEGIDISEINFSDQDHYLGNKDAQKIFVAYLDLSNTHSNRFYKTLKTFSEQNKDEVKIVWRHWPSAFNNESKNLAIASECADNFWDYVDNVYQGNLDYPECSEEALVDQHLEEGNKVGVSGTPNTIFIDQSNDTYKYIGGYVSLDYLQAILD